MAETDIIELCPKCGEKSFVRERTFGPDKGNGWCKRCPYKEKRK